MATKEKPILFSGPMVRAILQGRKTMTRRVCKDYRNGDQGERSASPFGCLGDRLWVRETFRLMECKAHPNGLHPCYKATGDTNMIPLKWKPSIFMPRWASRITLEITNIRVERLQDMPRSDAYAEGISPLISLPVQDFENLWDSLNKKRGYGWETNPWVWVIEFKRLESP